MVLRVMLVATTAALSILALSSARAEPAPPTPAAALVAGGAPVIHR